MGLLTTVYKLLFPTNCVFCGRISGAAGTICQKCVDGLPYTNDGGRISGGYFDYCVSPLSYTGDVRKSILRFKFKGKTGYAEVYGQLLAECIRKHLTGEYDVISWVPLSRDRAKTRGYDQAMLLALAAALELDDVAAETLRKIQNVPAQSTIRDRAQRRENISGAYEAYDTELIAGKRILLIDDIITTGATLSECAGVLLAAGAERVVCAALASTPRET